MGCLVILVVVINMEMERFCLVLSYLVTKGYINKDDLVTILEGVGSYNIEYYNLIFRWENVYSELESVSGELRDLCDKLKDIK